MTLITGALKWDLFIVYLILCVIFVALCCCSITFMFLCCSTTPKDNTPGALYPRIPIPPSKQASSVSPQVAAIRLTERQSFREGSIRHHPITNQINKPEEINHNGSRRKRRSTKIRRTNSQRKSHSTKNRSMKIPKEKNSNLEVNNVDELCPNDIIQVAPSCILDPSNCEENAELDSYLAPNNLDNKTTEESSNVNSSSSTKIDSTKCNEIPSDTNDIKSIECKKEFIFLDKEKPTNISQKPGSYVIYVDDTYIEV